MITNKQDSDGLPELITIDEFSAWAGVPPSTIHNWRYLGKGPRSFKIGRRIHYLRSDVMSWLEDQRETDPSWREDER